MKALFLDRDGIINIDKGYVYKIEDFEFIDGIFAACAEAQRLGYQIVVITNQSGIGRGLYTEADFQKISRWMLEQFHARQIDILAIYHCPYHPSHGIGEYRRESNDRKPNPGMILKARRDHDLDLAQSILVGDKPRDIEAGIAAGIGQNILIAPVEDQGKADLRLESVRQLADYLKKPR